MGGFDSALELYNIFPLRLREYRRCLSSCYFCTVHSNIRWIDMSPIPFCQMLSTNLPLYTGWNRDLTWLLGPNNGRETSCRITGVSRYLTIIREEAHFNTSKKSNKILEPLVTNAMLFFNQYVLQP